MNNKHILFLSGALLATFSVVQGALIPDAQKVQESPQKTTLYSFAENCGYEKVENSLKKSKKDDRIHINYFAITNTKLIPLLTKKAEEGVEVSLHICSSQINPDVQQKIIDPLQKAGAKITIYNANKNLLSGKSNQELFAHQKYIHWSYTKPQNQQKEYRLWHGSQNMTHLGERNKEVMVYAKLDEEEAQEFKKHHLTLDYINEADKKTQINNAQLSPLKKTPQKPYTIYSYKTNVNNSIFGRIENADKELYINCPKIDDSALQNIITQKAKMGILKLLNVDREMWENSKYKNFLKTIAAFVPVNIYNNKHNKTFGKFLLQNHAKMFARINADGKTLVGIGSGNFTEKSMNDINDLTFYPNDTEMTQKAIQIMQLIANDSELLQASPIKSTTNLQTTAIKRQATTLLSQPSAKKQIKFM